MAATATQKSLLKLTVGMFDAALGADLLKTLETELTSANGDFGVLANALATTPVFEGLYPASMTNTAFATAFINNLVGSEASDANKAIAVTWIEGLLNGGASRGDVMVAAINLLDSVDATNADWGNAKKALDNQTAAAEYYSVEKGNSSADIAVLKAVTATVTSNPDTIPADFTVAKGVKDLNAANEAKKAFLVTADGDNDAKTSATDAQINTALTNAFTAVDGSVTGTYASASTAVKAALLADQVAANDKTLADNKKAVTDAAAAVDKVAGLTAAVAALETAKTANTAADKASALADAALDTAVANYAILSASASPTTAVVTGTDGAFTGLIEVKNDVLVLVSGITETTNPGVTKLLEASVANEAAQKAALATQKTLDTASELVDNTDLSAAAKTALENVGTAFTKTTPTDAKVPTTAEITAEKSSLAAAKATTAAAKVTADAAKATNDTAATNAANAVNAFNALELAYDNALTAYDTASNATTQGDLETAYTALTADDSTAFPTLVGHAAIKAAEATTEAAVVAKDAALLAPKTAADTAKGLTDTAATNATNADNVAGNAVTAFDNAVTTYDTAANTNTLADALTTAKTSVTTAEKAITDLAKLVADQTAAQGNVDKLKAVDAAITAAEKAFTDAKLTVPVTAEGTVLATSKDDVFLVGSKDGTITNLDLQGNDTLYIGDKFTLNADKKAGENGDNAVLEAWITANGADTVVTLESTAFGSNAGTPETFEITLTGVAVADVSLANGFINVA